MSPETKIAIIGGVIVVITFVVVVGKFTLRRAPLRPRKKKYTKSWKALQGYCKDKATWPQALEAADKLLDKALVRKGFKGKSTGERLVNAQRKLSDNDAVWFGHKLYKKVRDNPEAKLTEKEVKQALLGFRQALKDLGAL